MAIHLPKKSDTAIGSKYSLFGLTDMPFPSDGFSINAIKDAVRAI